MDFDLGFCKGQVKHTISHAVTSNLNAVCQRAHGTMGPLIQYFISQRRNENQKLKQNIFLGTYAGSTILRNVLIEGVSQERSPFNVSPVKRFRQIIFVNIFIWKGRGIVIQYFVIIQNLRFNGRQNKL